MISRDDTDNRRSYRCCSGNCDLSCERNMAVEGASRPDEGSSDKRNYASNKKIDVQERFVGGGIGVSPDGFIRVEEKEYPIVRVLIDGVYHTI